VLITNQLLYQLSYVGTPDLEGFLVLLQELCSVLALIWPTCFRFGAAFGIQRVRKAPLQDRIHKGRRRPARPL